MPPAPGDATGSSSADAGTASGVAGQPAGHERVGLVPSRRPSSSPRPTALSDRSIVRTASLTLRVPRRPGDLGKASTLAEGLGGFVAGEKTEASPDEPSKSEAVVVLRVPADRLPALLTQLHGLGTLVSEDQSADDVTGQVIDVAARISAQRAASRGSARCWPRRRRWARSSRSRAS